MGTERPPASPASDFGRLGPRPAEEKLRILRLTRALDRASIDPKERPALRGPLVHLAEFDTLLTSMLEFIDREGPVRSSLSGEMEPLLRMGEYVRGEVTDALDPAESLPCSGGGRGKRAGSVGGSRGLAHDIQAKGGQAAR
jgi:hypothetical protein